jgi:DNA polymerase III alpha subunit
MTEMCYTEFMKTLPHALATEQQAIELLYRGMDIAEIVMADPVQYNSYCDELELDPAPSVPDWSKQFNVPLRYQQLDVAQYVRHLIPKNNDGTTNERVEKELELFATRNLFPVLQLLIYIVDVLRENNIVWGVGRGSSTASYVLYLIGVHKIDSLKYNLDIEEFLK